MIIFKRESYFYLFNLGLVSATLGLLLWLGFYSHQLSFYPIRAHGTIMFFSFLLSFVVGFLMTAVPKMTQSEPAGNLEISLALGLSLAHWIFNLTNFTLSSVYIYLLQLIFIVVFMLRRILITRRIPFTGFIFIPFATLMSFIGIFSTLFFSTDNFRNFYLFCGEAFILNLICGLGARLIPVISRVPSSLNPDQQDTKSNYVEFAIYALILNSSYFLEFFGYTKPAYLMRIMFLIIYAILKFKILHTPSQKTAVGWGLRTSVLGLIAGYILTASDTVSYLAGMHVVYIAGFTLLTIMVASRVTIAHSQRSTNLEINSKPIMLTIAFFIAASVFRYTLNSPQDLVLIFAALAYLLAIWTWKFFVFQN